MTQAEDTLIRLHAAQIELDALQHEGERLLAANAELAEENSWLKRQIKVLNDLIEDENIHRKRCAQRIKTVLNYLEANIK